MRNVLQYYQLLAYLQSFCIKYHSLILNLADSFATTPSSLHVFA